MGICKSKNATNVALPESSTATKKVDGRLPFASYRELFNLRNAWKSVVRNMDDAARDNLARFFHEHPNHQRRFSQLKDLTIDESTIRNNLAFENQALAIFTSLDDAMTNLENVDKAIKNLHAVGERHKALENFDSPLFSVCTKRCT